MQTKNFYIQDTNLIQQSQPTFIDWGISNEIPWNDIYTSGWYMKQPFPGNANKLVSSDKPEYWAMDDVVRSNVIPSIDVHDPTYHYRRKDHTIRLY